jgi:hypothetical protein
MALSSSTASPRGADLARIDGNTMVTAQCPRQSYQLSPPYRDFAVRQYDNTVSYFENVGAGESQTCFSAQRHIINSAVTGITDLTFADFNMDGAWQLAWHGRLGLDPVEL